MENLPENRICRRIEYEMQTTQWFFSGSGRTGLPSCILDPDLKAGHRSDLNFIDSCTIKHASIPD